MINETLQELVDACDIYKFTKETFHSALPTYSPAHTERTNGLCTHSIYA